MLKGTELGKPGQFFSSIQELQQGQEDTLSISMTTGECCRAIFPTQLIHSVKTCF